MIHHQHIVLVEAGKAVFGSLAGGPKHFAAGDDQALRHTADHGVGGSVVKECAGVDGCDGAFLFDGLVDTQAGLIFGEGDTGGGHIDLGGVTDDHDIGVEGSALHFLDVHTVGVVLPFVHIFAAAAGDHSDTGAAHIGGDNVQQALVTVADGIQGSLIQEQRRNPFGAAGLQQGHGQNIAGSREGAIEDHVAQQPHADHQQQQRGHHAQTRAAQHHQNSGAGFCRLLFLPAGSTPATDGDVTGSDGGLRFRMGIAFKLFGHRLFTLLFASGEDPALLDREADEIQGDHNNGVDHAPEDELIVADAEQLINAVGQAQLGQHLGDG